MINVKQASDDQLMSRYSELEHPDRNPDNADADKQEMDVIRVELESRGFKDGESPGMTDSDKSPAATPESIVTDVLAGKSLREIGVSLGEGCPPKKKEDDNNDN